MGIAASSTSKNDTLYNLLRVGRWSDALTRCHDHPGEVFYKDTNKCTCLHIAVSHQPPVEIVDALLLIHGSAVSQSST